MDYSYGKNCFHFGLDPIQSYLGSPLKYTVLRMNISKGILK